MRPSRVRNAPTSQPTKYPEQRNHAKNLSRRSVADCTPSYSFHGPPKFWRMTGSLTERILQGYVPSTEPSSFLLNLSSRRITQFFLSLDRRIGRLDAQNPLEFALEYPSVGHVATISPSIWSLTSLTIGSVGVLVAFLRSKVDWWQCLYLYRAIAPFGLDSGSGRPLFRLGVECVTKQA